LVPLVDMVLVKIEMMNNEGTDLEILNQSLLQCALRRTFLTGESPQSALVVGRIQPNTKGVHREVESEGR
jgi:hypothetical protein